MDKHRKSYRVKIVKKLFKKKKVFKITKIEKNIIKLPKINKNLIKNSKNSLISISKEVFDLLKINRILTGKQVTKHIENQIKNIGVSITFKNIQRRVYDALNVLSAIGIISKQKSNLVYNGEFKLIDNKLIDNLQSQKIKNNELRARIRTKQNQLMHLSAKNYVIEKLYHDNINKSHTMSIEEKILFPFFLIKLDNDSSYSIKQDETYNRICIFSDKQFTIMSQDEIINEIVKIDLQYNEKIKLTTTPDINTYIQKHSLIWKFLSCKIINNDNSTPKYKSFLSCFESEDEQQKFYLDHDRFSNSNFSEPMRDVDEYNLNKFETEDINYDSTEFNSKFNLR